MKNKRLEKYIDLAKKYKTTALDRYSYDPKRKIVFFHSYWDENGKRHKECGWWDDVSFVHGSQYISVCWTHPRYEYHEKCDSIAYEEATRLCCSPNLDDLFEGSKKNYKKVGRSRKKVVSYTSEYSSGNEGFYDTWKKKKLELLKLNEWSIPTSFVVKQQDWARLVLICCPIEVIDEDSLAELANLVRVCLDNPYKFNEMFSEYQYTSETWNHESEKFNWKWV